MIPGVTQGMEGIPNPLGDEPAEEFGLVLCVEVHDEFGEGFEMRDGTQEYAREFLVKTCWERG